MKNYVKNKESSSNLKYWNVNKLYAWAIPQKLPLNGFKWVNDISKFDEDFIKSYNEKSKEEYFLEVDIQYSENLHDVQNDFLPERMNIEKVEKFVANLHNKIEYVFT